MKLLFITTTLLYLARVFSANVKISSRRLIVDDKPFFVKGIAYNPTPVGETSGQWLVEPLIHNRDLPRMVSMGANTLRTYFFKSASDETANHIIFLDSCHKYGIKVIVGFTVSINKMYGDFDRRKAVLDSWSVFISKYKDHPAILMWLFGNELDFGLEKSQMDDLFSLVNEARITARKIEGSNWHPVSTAVADGSLDVRIAEYDYSVDVWALQIYRGSTFGGLWKTLKTATKKPAIITEFGVDAYDGLKGREDQDAQALYDSKLFKEIIDNSDVVSGGCKFQWSDGWWKTGNRGRQSVEGLKCNSPNDKICNDAWWGLYSISKGTPNVLTPRKSYYELQSLFRSARPYDNSQTPLPSPSPSPPNPSKCSNIFEQCGGNGWKGPTCCRQPACIRKAEQSWCLL